MCWTVPSPSPSTALCSESTPIQCVHLCVSIHSKPHPCQPLWSYSRLRGDREANQEQKSTEEEGSERYEGGQRWRTRRRCHTLRSIIETRHTLFVATLAPSFAGRGVVGSDLTNRGVLDADEGTAEFNKVGEAAEMNGEVSATLTSDCSGDLGDVTPRTLFCLAWRREWEPLRKSRAGFTKDWIIGRNGGQEIESDRDWRFRISLWISRSRVFRRL